MIDIIYFYEKMRSITDIFFATAIDLYDNDTITIYMKNIYNNIRTPCLLNKIKSNNTSNLYHLSCNVERYKDYNTFGINNSIGGSLNGDDIHYDHVQEIIKHDMLPPPGIDTYSVYSYMPDGYEQFQTAITIFVI